MHRTAVILLATLLPHLLSLSSLGGEPTAEEPPSVTRLTKDGDFKQHLQWSPDGKRFLFTRIHEGKMALWTMNADGSEMKPLLTPNPNTPHFDGHWSADGKKIVFVLDILQGTDGKLQINTCNADGTDSKTLIPNKAFEESPRWSPDGKSPRLGQYARRQSGNLHQRRRGEETSNGSPTIPASTIIRIGRRTASGLRFAARAAAISRFTS